MNKITANRLLTRAVIYFWVFLGNKNDYFEDLMLITT